jgi:hypothetical protein
VAERRVGHSNTSTAPLTGGSRSETTERPTDNAPSARST